MRLFINWYWYCIDILWLYKFVFIVYFFKEDVFFDGGIENLRLLWDIGNVFIDGNFIRCFYYLKCVKKRIVLNKMYINNFWEINLDGF